MKTKKYIFELVAGPCSRLMNDVVCHSLKSEAKNPPVAGTGSELVDFGSSSSPSIFPSSGLSTTPHKDPTPFLPFTAKLNAELNLKYLFFNEESMKWNQ